MRILGKAGKMGEIGESEKTGGPGKTEGPGKTGGPGRSGAPGRTGASGKSAKPVTKGKRAAACAAAAIIGATSLFAPAAAYGAQPWSLENGQYVDASGAPIAGALEKGITVTKYQNRANENGIDWSRVASDGVSFAMIRVGYYKDKDPYFDRNVTEAFANGIHTGVFFYTQALDVQTAIDEANFVLKVIKDFPISYPIAYDVESQHLLDNGLTRQQITDNVNAFCKTISDAGYHPVVYGNNEWLTRNMDTGQIPYDIWYARYGTVNSYPNRTIWQCTDTGSVDGINGNVTIELAFTDYSAVIPADGWKHVDGRWYYMKGYVKQTGWVEVDSAWYYLDANGVMIHDTTMDIDGVSYTFDSNGVMAEPTR